MLQAQTSARVETGIRASARGVDDLSVNKDEGKEERGEAMDTTTKVEKKKPQRGEGKSLAKGSEN